MTNKELDNKLNSIMEKIGDENANLILDDVALLLNDNKVMNENLQEKDNKISQLEKRNENLQIVNGNLLQQVSSVKEEAPERKEEFKPTIVDLKSVFDEKRSF